MSQPWLRHRGGVLCLIRFGSAVAGWALAAVSGVAGQARSAPGGHAAPVLVLDRVTVIDVESGRRLADQRVVIAGNRIQALGSPQAVQVPAGGQVVDARGKYLIPGLWDMHIHPAAWAPPGSRSHQVNAVYRQLIANGITGIRDAGSDIPLDTFRVWKQEIAAGQRVGPRLIVSGPAINISDKPSCTRATRLTCGGPPHFTYVADSADARHLVDSLQAAGADILKFRDLPRPIWLTLAAEARRVGIPFGGHFSRSPDDGLPATIDGLAASDSGALILDHQLWANVCGEGGRGDEHSLDLTPCMAATARLRRNHTWVTPFGGPGKPSMSGAKLPEAFVQRALRYSPPAEPPGKDVPVWQPLTAAERRQLPTGADWKAAWAKVLGDSATTVWGCRVARLAYDARLPWIPGPDWPMGGDPGVGVHVTLLNPVLCGTPPLWSLQAATLEPARALGLTDSLGTVAAGKVADLVLLDGDPLEDIWNITKIAAVVANGRYFDRPALDHLLVEASEEWRQVGMVCSTLPRGC